MLIDCNQIVAHLIGDYLLQSDWMANNKTSRSVAAAAHVLAYSVPFVIWFRPSVGACLFIAVSHFVIDRWRLARFVVWAKNLMAPRMSWLVVHYEVGPDRWFPPDGAFRPCIDDRGATTFERRVARTPPFRICSSTGYSPERPAWLTVWLLIVADNVLHLICNGVALFVL